MLIVGWNNKDRDPADVLTRSDTKRLIKYVSHRGMIGIACYQIPNSPINFENDPLGKIFYNSGRTEDAIIARTWKLFHDNPTFPDVLLRLPMTKGELQNFVCKCWKFKNYS